MKLAHVVFLALVSLVVTASPCETDDFEQLTIQFPADREQASENVVVDDAHDDWSDVQSLATSCTCAGWYHVFMRFRCTYLDQWQAVNMPQATSTIQ
jgi:hypothetical protein